MLAYEQLGVDRARSILPDGRRRLGQPDRFLAIDAMRDLEVALDVQTQPQVETVWLSWKCWWSRPKPNLPRRCGRCTAHPGPSGPDDLGLIISVFVS